MSHTCISYSNFRLRRRTGRVISAYISVRHNNPQTQTNTSPLLLTLPIGHTLSFSPPVQTHTYTHLRVSLCFPTGSMPDCFLKVRPGLLPLPSYTLSWPRPSGGPPAPAFRLSASQPDTSKTLLPGARATPGNMTKAEAHWAWQFTGGLQHQGAVVQTM